MDIKNFIAHIVTVFRGEDKSKKKVTIYKKIPAMTRQNFQDLIDPERTPSPFKWRTIRIALGMKREPFWRAAMEFHDPEVKRSEKK